MRKLRWIGGGLLSAGLGFVPAASAATFDFETSGQWDANFREVLRPEEMSQTSNGAANDFVRKTGSSLNTATVAILDLTPADGVRKNVFTNGFTVTMDIAFTGSGASMGIYAVDPNNEAANGLLALFNVDSSGSNDRFRFWSGSTPTNSGTGAAAGDTTAAGGSNADGVYAPITFTYSVSGTTPTMTIQSGTHTATSTFPAGTALANPEVALRVYGSSSASTLVDIDNLVITPESTEIPEPASAGLLAAGAVLGLSRRSRRRGE